MSKTCKLIHNGDFVKFSDTETSAVVSVCTFPLPHTLADLSFLLE